MNHIAAALAVPFTEEQISHRLMNPKKEQSQYNPMLRYVSPIFYRIRNIEAFEGGFTLHVLNTRFIPELDAFQADAHFIGESKGVKYDIKLPVIEPLTRSYEEKKIVQLPETMAKLASAAVKAFSREVGLGGALYLEDRSEASEATQTKAAAPAAKPAAKRAPAASTAPASAPDAAWDGSKEMTWGKNKGKAYSEIEDSYLTWAATKKTDQKTGEISPDAGSVKELARRQAGKVAVASQATAQIDSPEESEAEVPW